MILNIRDLLAEKRYKTKKYHDSQTEESVEFNKINNFGDTFTVFDDFVEKYDRPPTQTEYVEEYVSRVKLFMLDDLNKDGYKEIKKDYGNKIQYVFFKWNWKLTQAVEARASRTYESLLVEYTTEIQLREMGKKYGFTVFSNRHVDTAFGADLVLENEKGLVYVHVLADTKSSKNAMTRKAKIKGVVNVNDERYQWTRDWSKYHVELLYKRDIDFYSTNKINGNPILEEEYLKDCVDSWFADTENVEPKSENNSLNVFLDWLLEIGVNWLPF